MINPVLTDAETQTLDHAPVDSEWKIGTLTYTRAGLAILFCLLMWGDFAWSMKERSAAATLQIVIKDFHASDSEMQLFMVIIPMAIGIPLGPVVSYLSDRHRGRWGRRIPYLMVSTPFAVLAMMGLGFSPSMGQSLHNALRSLLGGHAPGVEPSIRICFGLFWVLFEVATVVTNSVFVALINDVVPSKFLGRFFGLFRALSLIAAMLFYYELVGLADNYFKAIFLGIGLLYGFGFTIMCLTVKEGDYPPPAAVDQSEHSGGYVAGLFAKFFTAAWIYLRECFLHRYYLWVVIALMLGQLTFMPVNNFSQPFAKSLHISNEIYGKYMGVTYTISLLLSVYMGYLADRFHPLRTGLVAMALYAVVTLWGEFYAASPTILFHVNYHSGGVLHSIPVQMYAIALIAHGVISGIFFTCTASFGQRLFPHARFAQFYSAYTVLLGICAFALAWMTGHFFDAHGPVYRHTYLMGFGLSILGIISMLVVNHMFIKRGGITAYTPP